MFIFSLASVVVEFLGNFVIFYFKMFQYVSDTHCVNFTNILQAAFSYKSFFAAFMCLQFGFVIFCQKDFGAKAANKMLVKLTPGGRNWQLIYPYSINMLFHCTAKCFETCVTIRLNGLSHTENPEEVGLLNIQV